jgi:hypothetical protein
MVRLISGERLKARGVNVKIQSRRRLRIQAAVGILPASVNRISAQIKFDPESIEEAVMRIFRRHVYLSIAALFISFSASAQDGGKAFLEQIQTQSARLTMARSAITPQGLSSANTRDYAASVAQQSETGYVRPGRSFRAERWAVERIRGKLLQRGTGYDVQDERRIRPAVRDRQQ